MSACEAARPRQALWQERERDRLGKSNMSLAAKINEDPYLLIEQAI
jgi:hypothetical protein